MAGQGANLNTPSGGVATTGTWSGAGINVAATSLGSAGSETSVAPSAGGNPGFTIGTGIGLSGLDATNWWLSGLVQVSATGNGFAGIQLFNAGTERFGIGINGYQAPRWAVLGASNYLVTNTLNPVTLATANTTALLVMNYNSGTGQVRLWVNPDLNQLETAPTAAGNAPAGTLTFDNVRIRGGGSISIKVDNIEVSNDSPFLAIPEPASIGLLVLGGIVSVMTRKVNFIA